MLKLSGTVPFRTFRTFGDGPLSRLPTLRGRGVVCTLVVAAGLAPVISLALPAGEARAQNPVYQAFFADICAGAGAPGGALAARCGETPGGGGDLSGDSEDSLNPSQFVGTNEGAILRARARQRELAARAEAMRGETADPDRRPRAGDEEPARFSLLLNGRGSWYERDATSSERGLEGDVWSVQAGGDVRVAEGAAVGALFTYDRLDSEFDADAPGVSFSPSGNEGQVDANWYSFSVFASFELPVDGAYADIAGSAGFADYEIGRNVVFQETNRVVPQTSVATRAEPDAWDVQGSGTLGYDFHTGPITVGPYGRLVYVRTEIDGFTETDVSGSGLHMSVDEQVRDSLVTIIGLRGSYAVSLPFGGLLPQARFEYEHEYLRDAQTARTSFPLDANGTTFAVRGENPDRNYFNLGGSLLLVLPHGWLPFVDYQGLVGYDDLRRHTVTFGVRKEL